MRGLVSYHLIQRSNKSASEETQMLETYLIKMDSGVEIPTEIEMNSESSKDLDMKMEAIGVLLPEIEMIIGMETEIGIIVTETPEAVLIVALLHHI